MEANWKEYLPLLGTIIVNNQSIFIVPLEDGETSVLRCGKKLDGRFTLISVMYSFAKFRIVVQAHATSLCSEITCDLFEDECDYSVNGRYSDCIVIAVLLYFLL